MYKIFTSQYDSIIFRVTDNTWIPMDKANTSYQQYLKWVAEGNVAEEWVAE